jgi:hypothetical protein
MSKRPSASVRHGTYPAACVQANHLKRDGNNRFASAKALREKRCDFRKPDAIRTAMNGCGGFAEQAFSDVAQHTASI